MTDIDPSQLGAVRSGEFVAEFIEPLDEDKSELPDEAVQPNGVDLSIGELCELTGTSHIGNDEYEKANREELSVTEDGTYQLYDDAGYVVIYDEKITIPEDHIGLVLPRSRIMRCGGSVETAVWDAGYSGVGEGGLSFKQPAELDEDLRIAQIVFIKTEELEEQYDGSHQNERVD